MKLQHLLILFFSLSLSISAFSQSNQYLHFDRVDDYVRLDGASQYITGKTALSMAGWFYTDALAYGQGMMGFRTSGNGFYLIQLANGTLECRLETNTGLHQFVGPNFTILPGVWQHVAWVYNGSNVTLYIDGVSKGSAAASGTLSDNNIPFTIGRSILGSINFYFGGRADEVSVWDKALTATDLQDMMANELVGNEANLQLYYKMNQGQPGGNNSSITKLISEVGGTTKDADLIGFAMNGNASNFLGTLQTGFQAISFDDIDNKLISDGAFKMIASATSMLPVQFTVLSGPATVSNDTLTLTGTAGTVMVEASQPGDMSWNPATPVVKSFEVVDPMATVPNIDLRSPLAGEVIVPALNKIQLAAIVNTAFPELLSVTNVEFEINGNTVAADDWGNEHYTGWWAPPAYGTYTLNVNAYNNFGAKATEIVTIDIVNTASDTLVNAFSDVLLNGAISRAEIDATLPSYLGAYNQINATFTVNCPPGGCDPWDRVLHLRVKTHEGTWVEIVRYITSYGVACTHQIDLTDYMSALQGKVTFRIDYGTFDTGFEYNLDLNYKAGRPNALYTAITPVWNEAFDFGDIANQQPVPAQKISFPPNAFAAKLKLVASGHGWGDNNTSNAAEFFNTTHTIWVDGSQAFTHANWMTCNPNPDGCQPQNGTWFYNRAGFCPGAISPWHDYNLTPYLANGEAELDYVFDPNYIDLCHPNHPNCVSGTTCPNCNDGFNPHLIVASNVISYSNRVLTSIEPEVVAQNDFSVYPNPSSGKVEVKLVRADHHASVSLLNALGQRVWHKEDVSFANKTHQFDFGRLPEAMYVVIVKTEAGVASKKLYLR